MFDIQKHLMTDQMQVALQTLLDSAPEKPLWLVSLLSECRVGLSFNLSFNNAAWLASLARSLNTRNTDYAILSSFILSECDPNNYFLLNSGVCNPSY